MAGESWQDEEVVGAYLKGIRGGIPLAQEQVDVVLRLIRHNGLPVRHILDLGCGDGFLGGMLLERFPAASGVFIDFSEPMLEEARQRLSPFESRCQIRAADLSRPDWRDALLGPKQFDVVLSGFAIHHLTDERKRDLYSEVLELLKPGAFFLNVDLVSSPTEWLRSAFDELLTDSLFEHQRSQGHETTREQIAEEYVHAPDREEDILASIEEQCAWLRELGFEDVDCYFKLFELAVIGGRRSSKPCG